MHYFTYISGYNSAKIFEIDQYLTVIVRYKLPPIMHHNQRVVFNFLPGSACTQSDVSDFTMIACNSNSALKQYKIYIKNWLRFPTVTVKYRQARFIWPTL